MDDAHAHLDAQLDYHYDKSISVTFTFSLHDRSASNTFSVPKDAWQAWKADISRDNDDSHLNFTVHNNLRQA